MNNAWKINDGAKTSGKAWANKDESPNKSAAQNAGARGGVAGSRPGTAQ